MAFISAKYLFAFVLSIGIGILSFEIGSPKRKANKFEETMNRLTSESDVSLRLVKLRIDTAKAVITREQQ